MKQTGSIALCGIVAALCVACMFMTGLIPFATYALPALAGVFLIVIVIEVGKKWALLAYFVVGVLSLILSPDLEAKLMFISFFGYYPIVKAILESFRSPKFVFCAKLAIFNAAVIALYFIMRALNLLPTDEFELFGINMPLVFLLLGNLVFLLYDYALSGLIVSYVRILQPQLRKLFRI